MAITFGIAPNPHWVIIDNFSKLPPGAAIYTYDSANKSVEKPAYQTPNINTPFTNPIVGFANGTMPPIYWAFNDALTPPDLYYIQVWDKVKGPNNVNGAVMLWDFDGLTGSNASGGGGGTVTTNLDLENLIVNGEFYWNVGNLPVSPATSVPALSTLAPSNHDGFVGIPNVLGGGPVAPDIIFAKTNTSATDSVSFTNFNQGDNFFSPAPTPQLYVNYTCSIAGSGETYKYIQFPIIKGLQNINNVQISIQIWAQLISGNTNIMLSLRQFCGNGSNGPSGDVNTSIGSLNFSGSNWTKSQFLSVTVPSISGLTLGNCGNDALYLQLLIPSGVLTNFNFILPAIYLGTATSQVDFHTRDFVDAVINSPRTGDTRTSLNSFSPYGWVPANDGTIGSSSSLATTRANSDTFALYDLIWNSVSNALAPVAGGRGASSEADFSANKAMALTRNLGRVMAGALPVAASQAYTRAGDTLTMTSTAGFYTGMAVTLTGAPIPPPLVVGTIYYVIIIDALTMSLASTTANALAGTVIPLTGAGSGTITSVNVETLASYIGEESHIQLEKELATHSHPGSFGNISSVAGSSNTAQQGNVNTQFVQALQIAPDGNSFPFNVIQPTVYMNVFIKL